MVSLFSITLIYRIVIIFNLARNLPLKEFSSYRTHNIILRPLPVVNLIWLTFQIYNNFCPWRVQLVRQKTLQTHPKLASTIDRLQSFFEHTFSNQNSSQKTGKPQSKHSEKRKEERITSKVVELSRYCFRDDAILLNFVGFRRNQKF